ncbi:MAG TPA: hypothetical protein VKY24_07765 [Reyranella sp.]|nr:hypothetical protein [Reyranella sp.]
MTQSLRWLPLLVASALPLAAAAQSDNAAYCKALIQSYQRYVIKTGSHSPNTGGLDGQVAMEHCRAGDTSGIPVLEQKLRDAGVQLPARG